MKKTTIRNIFSNKTIGFLFVMLAILGQSVIAKSKPILSSTRLLAFKRAKSLDNGVSVSWLEQTWARDILNDNALTDADFGLFKTLGFKSIRLPVAFNFFESGKNISVDSVLIKVDKVVKQCHIYGIKLIIDYHSGEFNDNNYLTETPKIIKTWQLLANRYLKVSADELFFEPYNEPPHMNPGIWRDAAHNIVTAVRKIDKRRTLIIGASNFNSIYELSRSEPLADENIIYTFHFYEPFFFTHQGAEWIGDQVATVGVNFPYSREKFPALNPKAKNTWGETNYYQYHDDGNEQSLVDKLMIVKKWGDKYTVPLLCGEYGVYNKYATLDSRCRYIKAMRQTLKKLNLPGMMWDYNGTFSIFEGKPSLQTLPDCMRDAIGYKN